MRIIYTYISDDKNIPEYTRYSLKKAREKNPCVQIDFICKHNQIMFNDYDINWVPQDNLKDGDILNQFNSVCKFNRHGQPNTTYPSSKDFWHRTAERIFYLQEHVSRNLLTDVFHLENDVVMFHPVESTLGDTVSDMVSAIRMSQTHATFAFCHIPRYQLLEKLCLLFIEMLELGEDNIRKYGGYDHVSEMSLLNLALRNNMVASFDILPGNQRYVYDPGSYGQYLGGTNNGHNAGFIDPTHYIGSYMLHTNKHPEMIDELPMIDGHKIFNLHIHSKNLKEFVI